MHKIPSERPDYLTPLRKQREYTDSMKGKYDIDWNEQKARAKLRRYTSTKQVIFLSHLANKGRIQD